jgi:hypothetical protein
MNFRYDPATGDDITVMRLLLNDVDKNTAVFSDDELTVFLALEGGAVKLAAAQAIDTNATNEALASKVLRTQDLATDGAKLAQALHTFAESLRAQHFAALEDGEDGFLAVVEFDAGHRGTWYC